MAGLRCGFGGVLRALVCAAVAVLLAAVAAGASFGAVLYDPASDMNSMFKTSLYSGASAWWSAGYTGAGVDVALIDTGVSAVEGLATPGKLVYGPDLSLESQSPDLRDLDTNGHGTFMAGLIAGKDTALTAPYASAPASAYRGMAPDARIVSLKVGVADGGVDVSQVIAAINWVVQHRNDNGLNIRVINLAYGTNSTQDSTVDPLSFAAEQAWKKGIVVVVAGGNSGFQKKKNAPALSNPAFNRYLIAVGSSDSLGTASLKDDQVPSFSPWPKSGHTRGVDLVAPGAHIQGLRVPSSHIDLTSPGGRLLDSRYFRGSGTSQSAAIISGAAALILQRYPDASPDQVKGLLTSTGYQIKSKKEREIGGGELDLASALTARLPSATQTWPSATGTGSLELARGTDHLIDDGVALTGEMDIFGHTFDAASMAAAAAAGTSWSGDTWNGNRWTGNGWSGNRWSGTTWSGSSWSGNAWSGNRWSGNRWSGTAWSGDTWTGNSWSGNRWSGDTWAGGSWS